jgi:hypothetical protein
MSRRSFLVPLVVSVLAVRAASARDIDAEERVARTACLSGDYAKGVAILSELFVATEDPVFIYNQGRCFEQNRRCDEAIARFEEYLRVGRKLTRSEMGDAQKHITACQVLLAKQGAAQSPVGGSSAKEAKERAARKACLTGDVDKGVDILADLFLDTRDINHIFNQGRCLEQNRRFEEAISRFQEFLVKGKDLSEEERTDARKHIELCRNSLPKAARAPANLPESQSPDRQPDPPPPARLSDSAAEPSVPTGQGTPSVTKQPTVVAGGSGGWLRTTGIVAVTAGAASLVTGVVLNLKYVSVTSDLEKPYNYNRGMDSDRASYKTWALVGYGAGAALVAGGGVLCYLAWRRGSAAASSLAVLPMPIVGGAGSMLTGTF